jgi:hypothetical protein
VFLFLVIHTLRDDVDYLDDKHTVSSNIVPLSDIFSYELGTKFYYLEQFICVIWIIGVCDSC